jgi:hypothetical protein
MMNPKVTDQTDLGEILSETQINVLRAVRDGAIVEVFYTHEGSVDYIELRVAEQKTRYVRRTTFDYLSRIAFLIPNTQGECSTTYKLSAVAQVCLAKYEGQPVPDHAAQEATAAAHVPAPAPHPAPKPTPKPARSVPVPAETEPENEGSKSTVRLSQAQVNALRLLLAEGAYVEELWAGQRLIGYQVKQASGRVERLANALVMALLRKGALGQNGVGYVLTNAGRKMIAPYC